MKFKHIDIEMLGFDILFIETNVGDEHETAKSKTAEFNEVIVLLESMKLNEGNIDYIETRVCDMIDSGIALYNNDERTCAIIIANPSHDEILHELISHEKRHVEDNILDYCEIDDREAAAYLSGYLAKKIYSLYDE